MNFQHGSLVFDTYGLRMQNRRENVPAIPKFDLGKHTTVFQTEAYAILSVAHTVEAKTTGQEI